MWVTCPKCNGNGYIKKDGSEVSENDPRWEDIENNNTFELCNMCFINLVPRSPLNIFLRGQIWVEDNFIEPFTPPSSPR